MNILKLTANQNMLGVGWGWLLSKYGNLGKIQLSKRTVSFIVYHNGKSMFFLT